MAKVVRIEGYTLYFDNGISLTSDHNQSCCESHWLGLSDLSINDFDGLEFDLDSDDFFERIPGYGIALKPILGFPIRIPGYGSNNGYYNSDLSLVLIKNGETIKSFDIDECQDYQYD